MFTIIDCIYNANTQEIKYIINILVLKIPTVLTCFSGDL